MTTAQTLINDALIDLGVYAPEQTLKARDTTYGLRQLNRMLGSWSAENLMIPYTTTESFSISSGTASYTMGTAGTASSTRARRILDCYIRDGSSIDYPVEIIDQSKYNSITLKTTGGRPIYLFYDPVYPVGVIYFYYTPDGSYTAYIESTKDLHSTLSLTTTVSLPVEYENAIVFNLRNTLAGSYGKAVTQYMYSEAERAKNWIKNVNASNRLETMDMPAGVGGSTRAYNINEG